MNQIIDLTHVIDPEAAGRKFHLATIGANEVNHKVVRLENQWYIMHDIEMVSHIGTHIEAPYHLFRDRADLAEVSIEQFCGNGVLLDLRGAPPKAELSLAQIKAAAEQAGGVRSGDIVLCNLGYSKKYGAPEYGECPYFSNEAIVWLAEQGIHALGVDAGGVEIPASELHENHAALFSRDVLLIENLANLDALPSNGFTVFAMPVPIKKLEAFPLRVFAWMDGQESQKKDL